MSGVTLATASASLFDDDESRWDAVRTRHPDADGLFVYGVRTTRIFCRPICKARLARRANVTFYASALEARAASFRACKRCRPETVGSMPVEAAVRKIRAFIDGEPTGLSGAALSLGQMAKRTGLSKWHFHRVFKRCVGMTPTEYMRLRGRTQTASDSSLNQGDSVGPLGPLSWSSPPAAGMDLDWISQYDLNNFDLESVMPTLGRHAVGELPETPLETEKLLGEGFSWADLVAWPDEDLNQWK